MKKMISRIKGRMAVMAVSAKAAVSCKRGEGYIGEALKILIAVVLGALLLAGLYLLFNEVVLPNISENITELFNYTP